MFDLGLAAVIASFFVIIAMFTIAGVCRAAFANTTKPADQVDQLVEHFNQWNEAIMTKQGFIDFYNQLNAFCVNVVGSPLKLNMTKDEFNQLSVESIRQLNRDALKSLIYRR